MTRAVAQHVVGIGGTLRPGSSSEQALRYVLAAAQRHGAVTTVFTARDLDLPMYDPMRASATSAEFVAAVRSADKVVIASPGYHGGISGLLKNALDYLQDLAEDRAPYLHGRAVGTIVSAAGAQAGVTALTSLRSTVHALRAWPTPLGVVINSATPQFTADGAPVDPSVTAQLNALTEQLLAFSQDVAAFA